jgi:hypothetical protein
MCPLPRGSQLSPRRGRDLCVWSDRLWSQPWSAAPGAASSPEYWSRVLPVCRVYQCIRVIIPPPPRVSTRTCALEWHHSSPQWSVWLWQVQTGMTQLHNLPGFVCWPWGSGIFFFFFVLGFELWSLHLVGRALYGLSHAFSPPPPPFLFFLGAFLSCMRLKPRVPYTLSKRLTYPPSTPRMF